MFFLELALIDSVRIYAIGCSIGCLLSYASLFSITDKAHEEILKPLRNFFESLFGIALSYCSVRVKVRMQLFTAKGVLTVFDIKLSVISWKRCVIVDDRYIAQWLPDGNGYPGEELQAGSTY